MHLSDISIGLAATAVLVLLSLVKLAGALESFVNFESGHVRPLVLSPSRQFLFAVNTPDNRLEIFRVTANGLQSVSETVVGLDPVALAVASESELYVVNHLSDSVSVVDASDPTQPFVKATLLVGDEPRDIVLAGTEREKLFVTTAHRGQNHPGDPQFTAPGIGQADVWVFDREHLDVNPHILTLFCDTSRALAVNAEGTRVYAAAFHSGNQTTVLDTFAVSASMRNNDIINDGFTGLGIPPPTATSAGVPAPGQSVVVKFMGQQWVDAALRDWTARVRFHLPDKDVFEIDATQTPPVEIRSFSGAGTILFNMAIHPQSGDIYVSNLESRNHIRFEPEVRGHITENRITILAGEVQPVHLNPHIDYSTPSGPQEEIGQSLAFPMQMVFTPDGEKLYVAAFGSDTVGILNAAGMVVGRIPVGGGPNGLALDPERGRLYVMNRFDHTISIVDIQTEAEIQTVPLRYSPEPEFIRQGRKLLYNARNSSGHGDSACASCHIFGDVDSLAWDLGDPDGRVEDNPIPPVPIPGHGPLGDFHPMKGPMATQSLRGLLGAGAMHWRGDRNGGRAAPFDEEAAFMAFHPAFQSLLGRASPFPEADMEQLRDFVFTLTYPPNPVARIDGTLTGAEQAGKEIFEFDGDRTELGGGDRPCTFCHVPPIGTEGRGATEGFPQDMKVPHLRNLYQKAGMFGYAVPSVITDTPVQTLEPTPTPHMGDQVRGFGYEHDASTPTLLNFLRVPTGQFAFPDEPDRTGTQKVAELTAYLLTFDTGLAPVVGQQVTLTSANLLNALPRYEVLQAQADVGTCDLVIHGILEGIPRGLYYHRDGSFRTDRAGEELTAEALRQLVRSGTVLTVTAVPPGSGYRMGVDRDEDNWLNRDEIERGTDPADPSDFPQSF
ncbi:MAG: hypothetical protein ETSY2_16690 [Candidatus Entotheonella gemina]|uniref:Cytochrome c domain-containing protein n=1 Tax=Candidatus Entotheonella gemina TaxID=1429439 RepID=W4MA53_9BACT|nr:MAG: hypothetical protein ETSY2_16690 [Candidatus Entotheonella gemina]